MPTDEALEIVMWAAGLLLVLVGILMTIARLAIARHTGRFDPPWRYGFAPFILGMALITVSAYRLGVRDGLTELWLAIVTVGIAMALVHLIRRH